MGSTTVAGHTLCYGERIEFLMASVYSHEQRQEVRDACASTRCLRINIRRIKTRFEIVDELKSIVILENCILINSKRNIRFRSKFESNETTDFVV